MSSPRNNRFQFFANAENKEGQYNPLHFAVAMGSPEFVSYYMKEGVDPEAPAPDGLTPIGLANQTLYKLQKEPDGRNLKAYQQLLDIQGMLSGNFASVKRDALFKLLRDPKEKGDGSSDIANKLLLVFVKQLLLAAFKDALNPKKLDDLCWEFISCFTDTLFKYASASFENMCKLLQVMTSDQTVVYLESKSIKKPRFTIDEITKWVEKDVAAINKDGFFKIDARKLANDLFELHRMMPWREYNLDNVLATTHESKRSPYKP